MKVKHLLYPISKHFLYLTFYSIDTREGSFNFLNSLFFLYSRTKSLSLKKNPDHFILKPKNQIVFLKDLSILKRKFLLLILDEGNCSKQTICQKIPKKIVIRYKLVFFNKKEKRERPTFLTFSFFKKMGSFDPYHLSFFIFSDLFTQRYSI